MLNDDEYTARGADSRYFSSEIAAAAAADAIKIMIADEVIKELVTHDGEHDLTVGFIDGEATLRFKVTGLGNAPDAPVSPVSGGGGGCAAGAAALVAIAALAATKRRKR